MNSTLSIGFVTDEVDADLARALDTLHAWGVRHVELRNLSTGRVPALTESERGTLQRHCDEHGLVITALSPGLFKRPITDAHGIEREIGEDLRRTIRLARALGVSTVIVFGFMRDPAETWDDAQMRDQAAHHLRRAANIASDAGLVLAVENEHGFVCDSGGATADVLRRADAAGLHVQWDPCNAVGCGEEPFPAGYEAVRAHIAGVHVKDTVTGSHLACVPVGEGVLDWQGQLAALVRDRATRHITIETHCTPLRDMSLKNLEVVRGMLRAQY